MKTLIAGFGSIGRRHLNNLRALGETDFVLLRSHLSTLPDDDIKSLPVETTIDAALTHKPQAVIISNPSSLHLDVAIPAAKEGCSILMEKPVSHSMSRIDELQSALKQGGGQLLVGYQFRFHPGLRQIKAWLDEGKIGKPVSSRAHWGEYMPGWHPWEDYRQSYAARADLGGGVVNTLCHPLDYQRWLFGEVESLWANTSNLALGLEVDDTAEIGLQFKSGVLSSTHVDYVQRPGQHTLQIIGTDGSISWDNATGIAKYYQANTEQWLESSLPTGFERNFLFMDESRHFLDIVNHKTSPICSLEDGIAAIQLTEAIHRSAISGEKVKLN
ncbi:MAG TPA: gfo/Idh/MocA family oxidoreductase [Anaerolineaceae bacterium]|nr:gfo/Idh/MocA family oxidoreductase [Anaerolineaceae bacterium]